MFMCQGQIVFHGPATDAVSYFSRHGYQCEIYDNPADFILDLLIDVSQIPDTVSKLSLEYNTSITNADGTEVTEQQNALMMNENKERLRHMFTAANNHSIGVEILYISQRTLVNAFRNPALGLSQIVTAIVLGLLVGFVFNNIQKTTNPGIQNLEGAIFFMVISQFFTTLSALEPFIKERAIFIHVSLSFNKGKAKF
jgi:ATP-binding cassette subfamily G (WHITE) protein 2